MTKVEELGFSARTYNCLKRMKIDTVEQLAQMSDEDLLQTRSFGAGCLAEVRRKVPRPKETNADRIRAMTDEELAAVIMCPMEITGNESMCTPSLSCLKCALKWLQSPAEVVR